MALPQSVDPTSLNISGKPAIATAPTTTTSVGATGMPMPTIAMEKNEVPLGAGALLGYALGNLMGNRGTALTGTPTGQTPSGQTPSGQTPSGSKPTGSTPTGNIGSVNSIKFPAGTTQDQIDAMINPLTGLPYGKTNGQSNYVISGVNMQNGEVVALPNDKIGGTNLGTNTGNFGFEAGTGTGGTTGGTTQTGNQYFQDSSGNVYDADGTLIYYNPSSVISGGTMDGGGYDPNADTGSDAGQFFQSDAGDIYDYAGNLVLEYGNGYYYEPDTGNYYDSNFDVVGDDFSFFEDFMGLPAFDSSMYGDLGDYFDYGNYTSGSTTYIKDGGSVKGGLATPLFKKGGSVPRFAEGSTGGIDLSTYTNTGDPLANTSNLLGVDNTVNSSNLLGVNTPVATATNLTNPVTQDTSQSGIVNTISNLLGNKGVSGALLGTLIAQLLNSTEQPVNKGVDMTALGTLKPRTTPTGPARFVPYSEYGTPTTPYDYSQLYANLGVSPFGAGAGALSPSATPTTPTSAQPVTTPTTPTGGLPAITAPTTPTTPTQTTQQYFQDADGNIYNANGDLVYDTTTGTTTAVAQQTVAPSGTTQASVAPMSGLAVTTPEASSSYYSYGSDVNPAQVLSSKKGGAIKKFADGGLSDLAVTSLYDATNPDYVSAHEALIAQPSMATMNNQFGTVGYNMAYNSPEANAFYDKYAVRNDDGSTYISPEGFEYLYSIDPRAYATDSIVQDMPVDVPLAMGNAYDDSSDFPIRTMAGETPLPYERVTTSAPTDFAPPSFSDSPTFRYSGARNPLLSGLSMTPTQPYRLAQGGSPHGNANIPVTEGNNPNVPIVQGRQDYRKGAYVQGAGDGQSDDIPAMLADGEYVIDAETVAQLGNGSNKAGAKMLDEFRENIRAHKRSAPTHKIPPKSKSALAYLKGAK